MHEVSACSLTRDVAECGRVSGFGRDSRDGPLWPDAESAIACAGKLPSLFRRVSPSLLHLHALSFSQGRNRPLTRLSNLRAHTLCTHKVLDSNPTICLSVLEDSGPTTRAAASGPALRLEAPTLAEVGYPFLKL